MNFEEILNETLDAHTLTEVEKYGYAHFLEEFPTETGQTIKVAVYELEHKTYLIRYVDAKCVIFRDITALPIAPFASKA
jgi:hypothetical protein